MFETRFLHRLTDGGYNQYEKMPIAIPSYSALKYSWVYDNFIIIYCILMRFDEPSNFPCAQVTSSALILQDFKGLRPISELGLVDLHFLRKGIKFQVSDGYIVDMM